MYHHSKHSTVWWVAAASIALLGALSSQARGQWDLLWGDEHKDLTIYNSSLTLWDSSSLRILEHGRVDLLEAHGSSTVDISGGTAGGTLNAYDSSTVNISGSGEANYFYAHNSSTVNISGGRVDWLHVHDSNTVGISGGSVTGALKASGSSIVDIRGGTVDELYAYESTTITFYGSAFQAGSGITFDGQRVLGTGTLEGKWADGQSWAVDIQTNRPSATILAIPEPSTLAFLSMGTLALLAYAWRRRQAA